MTRVSRPGHLLLFTIVASMSVRFASFILVLLFVSCRQEMRMFEKVAPAGSGIDFTNTITESKEHNVFTYQYYYNGNGVAIGDINNDDLPDIFFTGNQTPSKLFVNKGKLRFEDITAKAQVAGKNAWRTGANMADVNGDGLLDIYVCYSGFGSDQDRANQLFVNKGNNAEGIPLFEEKAAAYGLDAVGTYTSQSAFFDFDRDGDLDMFLLNHADEFYSPFFNTDHLRNLRHPKYGNRFYRNDNGHYTDISSEAGIFGSGLNFGLGISVSDLNNDGWPDVFVTNDFHEQDFCYLNNRDGTFKEVSQQAFRHMSRNTMGSDIADFNNDLIQDVLTLDMLPESNYRRKILQGADEYDKYNLMVTSGYGHQNNRNMLQLGQGMSAKGIPVYSEIGQLAGVSNTDWSWAALFADLDNDGLKDLFVTNGYLRESTNLDFMKYDVAQAYNDAVSRGLDVSTASSYNRNMPLYDLVKKMPSSKISNYVFKNKGDLTFSDQTTGWGLDEPSVSSGASYADLDNDGDLDLVVCNNNDPVWLYRNNSDVVDKNNYIKVKLTGSGKNTKAVGAKVMVTTGNKTQLQELYPVRGYQSSVDYVLNFGIGKESKITEVRVLWGDSESVVVNPAINTTLHIEKSSAVAHHATNPNTFALFKDITSSSGLDFVPKENEYVDFKREFLIPYELSRQGPKMSKADVNGDGLEDLYIGGPAEQSSALYLQTAEGGFRKSLAGPWLIDAIYEDVGSVFFDADNDGDPDLYVVSGGNEWAAGSAGLQDRLYINDGKGKFTRDVSALPKEIYSGSCVKAFDFDKDGDLDLFVGARISPGNYPFSEGNMILRNDGDSLTKNVRFTDVTTGLAGVTFSKTGMVTDATWTDIDNDGWTDLLVAGDWMPVTLYRNENGKRLVDITSVTGLDQSNGWWCKIVPADIDKDGDMDFIVGNLGRNTQFKASIDQPIVTYVDDFNNDGKKEPLLTWFIQGKSYPFNSRDELVEQMPHLNKKFLKYADYAEATIEDIVGREKVAKASRFYIRRTETSLLINDKGRFTLKALPIEAQFSMANGILFEDFDKDGIEDILLSGNFYAFRAQQGRCDASVGCLLKGDGRGNFKPVDRKITGVNIDGDVRDLLDIKGRKRQLVIVSKNNEPVQVIAWQ